MQVLNELKELQGDDKEMLLGVVNSISEIQHFFSLSISKAILLNSISPSQVTSSRDHAWRWLLESSIYKDCRNRLCLPLHQIAIWCISNVVKAQKPLAIPSKTYHSCCNHFFFPKARWSFTSLIRWRFQPISIKCASQIGSFSQRSGWSEKILETTWNHLANFWSFEHLQRVSILGFPYFVRCHPSDPMADK